MKFTAIGMSLISAFVFIFTNYKNRTAPNSRVKTPGEKNPDSGQNKKNRFIELRNQAFTITPEPSGLSLIADEATVYGMVMDWGMDDSTATIVSYQTGEASLYLSTGGISVGCEYHENVKKVAKEFVLSAQNYLPHAIKTETNILPQNDMISFYFLTNNGIFSAQEKLQNLEDNSSSWLELFKKGNDVLSELRLKNKIQNGR